MSNITPFEGGRLAANIASLFKVERLGSAPSGGFPSISIKGKVFHKIQGDEKELITKPGEEEPAASIEVVIIARNPHRSKVFYATGYTEGSDAKPTCYSNNGIGPEADASEPQAKKCATCAHNQWGARISENGSKGKACSDSQRLAVAPVGMINDPMMIRVPAGSLKALDAFGDTLVKRGVPYQLVTTRIGFDYSVAHPALTFKPVGMLDEATALKVSEVASTDVIQQIIGVVGFTPRAAQEQVEEAPAIAYKVEAPKKPVVEEQFDEPVVAPVAKPKKPVVVEVQASGVGSLEDDIANVMAGLDFDD